MPRDHPGTTPLGQTAHQLDREVIDQALAVPVSAGEHRDLPEDLLGLAVVRRQLFDDVAAVRHGAS